MDSPQTLDTRALRHAFGCFPTGVTIVTARRESGEPFGLTANSFSSVSLEPPLVLWSLARRSPNLEAFARASHFAINVLAADQTALSDRFARPHPDKFDGFAWTEGVGGVPLLAGAVAHIECRNSLRHPGGDHLIFLGEVERFSSDPDRTPLVFCRGRYTLPQPVTSHA